MDPIQDEVDKYAEENGIDTEEALNHLGYNWDDYHDYEDRDE